MCVIASFYPKTFIWLRRKMKKRKKKENVVCINLLQCSYNTKKKKKLLSM